MSYAKAELAKWRKVLVSWLISSDDSEDEDYKGVLIVRELPWRSESHSLLWEIGCSTWCKGVPEGCPADLVSVLKRITIRATIVDNLPVWATKSIWLSCSWIDQLLLFFLNWLIILELTYSSSIDLLLFLNWLILVLKSTFYCHSLINFIFILIDSLFLNWLQLCVILELASLFFLNVLVVILIDFSCSWINFLANEWAI